MFRLHVLNVKNKTIEWVFFWWQLEYTNICLIFPHTFDTISCSTRFRCVFNFLHYTSANNVNMRFSLRPCRVVLRLHVSRQGYCGYILKQIMAKIIIIRKLEQNVTRNQKTIESKTVIIIIVLIKDACIVKYE